MEPLEIIRLEELTGFQSFLPFDIRSYEAIQQTEAGSMLLKRLWHLFRTVDFEFSSPGNSFPRNVLIEVNLQYRITQPKRLLGMLEHDPALAADYDSVIAGITAAMSGIKTRTMAEEKLNVLLSFDYDQRDMAVVSESISYEGIEQSMRTFENIPEWVLRKIRYG